MLLGFDNERNANEQTLVKEKQLEAEFGDTIQLCFALPNGETYNKEFRTGHSVQFVKAVLHHDHNLPMTMLGGMALTAVVTGASGYLAGEVIHQLLAKGYNVRGTVTNVEDRRKTGPLVALRKALPGKLTLTEADLFEPGSFDDVVKGADFVFHTASNVIFDSSNPERDLIEPAVKGTSNVLRSVARNRKTVRRVVFSSSIAAIEKKIAGPDNGKLYTEDDWNNEATIDKYPYHLSKTLAEKLAWDLSTEYKFDLVSINPSFMLGPAVSAYGTSNSIMEMKNALEGREFVTLSNKLCDIRDGARAHILAAEHDDAEGRYIVALKHTVDHRYVTDLLQRRFPEYEIYTGKQGECIDLIDISRITKEFGMSMYNLEETIVDMAVSLVQLGIATPTLKAGY